MAPILAVLLSCVFLANTASIPPRDSYQPLAEDDINNNIIPDDDYTADIEGLLPPKPKAEDYFSMEEEQGPRNSTYVIDEENKQMKLKDDAPFPRDETPSDEKEAMKELQELFDAILKVTEMETSNSSSKDELTNLRPVITLTHDGINLEFSGKDVETVANVRESTTEVQGEPSEPSEEPQSDEPRNDDDGDSLFDFFHSVWTIVRSSVDYASNLFSGLIRAPSNDTEAATPSTPSTASSASSLVALEEPIASHRLPSHEFEKGGRDIDSLLYGRGIEA